MNNAYLTALSYRPLSEDGDMTMGLFPLTGLDAMNQALLTRLKLYDGEWWEEEDIEDALPMMTRMLGGPLTEENMAYLELMIVDRVRNTVGVTDVTDISSERIGRRYLFTCSVDTVYGETEVELEL